MSGLESNDFTIYIHVIMSGCRSSVARALVAVVKVLGLIPTSIIIFIRI